MVINDFHIFRTRIGPAKTDTPLIVDANAVLAETVTLESFKVIPGRHSQIIKTAGDLELPELTSCDLSNLRELPDALTF